MSLLGDLLNSTLDSLSSLVHGLINSGLGSKDGVVSSLQNRVSNLLALEHSSNSCAVLSGQNGSNNFYNFLNGSLNFLSGGLVLGVTASYEHSSGCEHKCNLFHFFAF